MANHRVNLFAYTEPTREVGYVGYASLNVEGDAVLLTVRAPGQQTGQTLEMPRTALGALAEGLRRHLEA